MGALNSYRRSVGGNVATGGSVTVRQPEFEKCCRVLIFDRPQKTIWQS